MSVAPVNPAEFMSDIVVNEGTRKTPKTKEEKTEVFREMLAEQIFLKDVFNNENSIYKPSPEDDPDGLSMSSGLNSIYSDYMRKQMAAQVVKSGFLEEVGNGR